MSEDSTTWDKILLFGDSITQDSFNQQRGFGFSPGLQHGKAFSPDTLALKVLPHVIPSPENTRIRLFVVFLGANDASLPEAENKQHVPLPEYISNLEKIITHPSVTAHKPEILLVAPAPIDEHFVWANDKSQGRASVSRKNVDLKTYSEAAIELGEKLGVPTVDLWKAFMARTGWEEGKWTKDQPIVGSLDLPQHEELVKLMHDGLHFNPAGYQILLTEVLRVIREKIPDVAPENIPFLLPLWNDHAAWEAWEAALKKD
ncbi:hypothetical protein N0V90_007795 [Kalmusia sp. IMI 367209]|nr:hypothetical protein N0V90_007795 [Kalmusia sp. IMI 367209]